MRVRVLVWVNVVLAVVLMAFVWSMAPFAQGVACEASLTHCTSPSSIHRALSAAWPGLLVLALAWLGAKLYSRSHRLGVAVLIAGPGILLGWVILVWATHMLQG